MNICVVGGSGFIGTRLVKRLLGRHQVRIADKKPSVTYPDLTTIVDVRDAPRLREVVSGAEVLINLAAEHRDDVQPLSLYEEVNVGGARNLCLAAQANGIQRIVFTSSVAVYGIGRPNTDEAGAINPSNEYGRTKAAAEECYRQWHGQGPGRTLVTIRPTVVFGEGNRGNVYNLLSQIAGRKFLMVGGGDNVKSMAYVENVAAFIEHCLSLGQGEHLFNYVDKPDLDMNALVRAVREFLGRPGAVKLRLPFALGYAAGLAVDGLAAVSRRKFTISAQRVRKFCASTQFSSVALEGSAFRPPVPLLEGLRRTLEWEFSPGKRTNEALFYSE